MARIRTIKPDFFTSDTVSALPLRARLTWIGLWTHCDDYGRCRDNVKLVKAAVWPLDDVSLRDVESDLDELAKANVVYRYTVEGKPYLQVTNWAEHQKVDRPSKSTIPEPPTEHREDSRAAREDSSSPRDGKGREGKGREGTRAGARESPPPDRCTQHANTPDPPPCGPCGDARRTRDTWHREQAARAAADQQTLARQRAEAARAAIAACRLCDSDGYAGPYLCAHDPTVPDRAHRGAAAARAAVHVPDPEGPRP